MFTTTSHHPYRVHRLPTLAQRGMVATSHHLAAQAGLQILQAGGNAIDAALATAATLTVVEPTSNGIGGDAFALIWTKNMLYGLNASGPAPQAISIEALTARGHTTMPQLGWEPVTVPGVPAAWADLSRRFGRLPLPEILFPAISYAKSGYRVTHTVARAWNQAYQRYLPYKNNPLFAPWFETFAPKNRAPQEGELWSSMAHAETLRIIGETQAADFYLGEIASQIASFSQTHGGFLQKSDLASFSTEWVNPISMNYRDFDVWELPPNGHGVAALAALQILQGLSPINRSDELSYHQAIEAIKLAMSDASHYITDPRYMSVSVEDLLSPHYASERRKSIRETAQAPLFGKPQQGGTVYLATADQEGNMVSYIQSNYEGFGSGIVIPGTGIALHNRGYNFNLDAHHPNCLAGGKRPYHTIIPGFLTKKGTPIGPFGVMGGFNQPQGHVQAITNAIDCNLDPQATLDAPRWRWLTDKRVIVEPEFPPYLIEALRKRGHIVEISHDAEFFGRGQIIWKDPQTGMFIGGTDSRADGIVVAY